MTIKTKTEHTPGPWIANEVPDFTALALVAKFGLKDGSDMCVKYEIATCAAVEHTPKLFGPTYIGIAYQSANANLIAAAPEMLEALERMVTNFYNGTFTRNIQQQRKDAEFAKAAIQKARGGQ